jgi:UDP-glucose 4-epimerase
MSDVLITGGAGFIGSHLADRLCRDGRAVTVLDDFSTGTRRNIIDAEEAGAKIVEGSVLDGELVESLVAANPMVFHLAAGVGVHKVLADPLGAMNTNVHGTEHVLRSAALHGSRVLLASTSEIYGRSAQIPFREDGDRVLGPTWTHRWSYSTAKALDEHMAFAYAERGLRCSIVRYFNVYGPRIDESGYGSVVAKFIAQALSGRPLSVHGDGKQTRCFTFIADAVEGTIRCATREEAVGKVFNLGTAEEVSIGALANLVLTVTGSSSPVAMVPYESSFPIGFEDTRRRVPDLTRARNELAFQAKVDLREGLERTVAWCRQHYGVVGEIK